MNRYEAYIHKTVAISNEVYRLLVEDGISAWCGIQEILDRPEIFPMYRDVADRIAVLQEWFEDGARFVVTDGVDIDEDDGEPAYYIEGADNPPPREFTHISKVWAMARRNVNEQV